MQTFSINSGISRHVPIETRIAAIAEAGFDAVCLDFERDLVATEGSWESQLRLADKYGLPVENIHLTGCGMNAIWSDEEAGDAVTDRLIGELREMATLGIRIGVAHVTWGLTRPVGSMERGLTRYRRAVEAAEACGVVLALENSVFPEYVHYLLESIQSPALGFCFDSGHENAFTPGENYLDRYGDILVAMHLHTNDGTCDAHLPPFHPAGTIDWQKKVAQLKKTALFHRTVTLECNIEGNDVLTGFSDALAQAKRLATL
ncbi:MAG: sugar phosphate isomerase/epimerase [Clostridia bacterium]|nr:sugar phosphate isomerase/epimerase [Clostridia bacterium]